MNNIIEVIRVQKRKSPVRDAAINDLKVSLKRIFKQNPDVTLASFEDLGLYTDKIKGKYRLDYASKIKFTWLCDNGCQAGKRTRFGNKKFEKDNIPKTANAVDITSVRAIIEDNHLIKA